MRIATAANVRTTQAARTSLAHALKVSFTGGTVMGLGVAGLACIRFSSSICSITNWFMVEMDVLQQMTIRIGNPCWFLI